MKKKLFLFFLPVAILGAVLLVSFTDGRNENYNPVFMKRADLEKSVKYISGSRKLEATGKIYAKGSYLYVNQPYKGVYVINNTNPRLPVVEGYISVPGCLDIAIKDNIMYVDNSTDLVAFNLDTKTVAERVKEVLPFPLSPDGRYGWKEGEDLILVEWKKR